MLVDNGSSRAASTLSLRVLCSKLEQKLGRPVLAVSMAHSDKAPLDELGGTPAVLRQDPRAERELPQALALVLPTKLVKPSPRPYWSVKK